MTNLTFNQLKAAGKSTVDIWNTLCRQKLLGLRIADVRYLTDEEMDRLGWYRKSLVIFFDNGHHMYVSSDDEGNDAGALFTTFSDLFVIPVI